MIGKYQSWWVCVETARLEYARVAVTRHEGERMAAASTKSAKLRDYLLGRIENELRPHGKLPTERDLAEEFSVSRLTVRRVLDRLETEGRVYRIQGAGTFVSERRIAKSVELTSFSEDMRQRGLEPGSTLINAEEVHAGARIGYALQISPADRVIHIARVRTADGIPMCLENAYLPARLVSGLLGMPLDRSLYQTLSTEFRIDIECAEQTIRCTVLEPADAAILGVPPLSPAFAMERTVRDSRGRAIEHAEALYRGDRYAYTLTLHRRTPADPPAAEPRIGKLAVRLVVAGRANQPDGLGGAAVPGGAVPGQYPGDIDAVQPTERGDRLLGL